MASSFETACKFIGTGIGDTRNTINMVLSASPEDANHLFFGSKQTLLVVNDQKFPLFKDVLTELVRTTSFLTWLEDKIVPNLSVEQHMINIQKNLKFRLKTFVEGAGAKLEKKFGDVVEMDRPVDTLDSNYCQIFISFKKPRITVKPQHPRVEAIKVEDQQMKVAQKAASTKCVEKGNIYLADKPIVHCDKPFIDAKANGGLKNKSKKRKPLADITNMVDTIIKAPKNVLQKRVQIEKKLDQLKANPTDIATEFRLPELTQADINDLNEALNL